MQLYTIRLSLNIEKTRTEVYFFKFIILTITLLGSIRSVHMQAFAYNLRVIIPLYIIPFDIFPTINCDFDCVRGFVGHSVSGYRTDLVNDEKYQRSTRIVPGTGEGRTTSNNSLNPKGNDGEKYLHTVHMQHTFATVAAQNANTGLPLIRKYNRVYLKRHIL